MSSLEVESFKSFLLNSDNKIHIHSVRRTANKYLEWLWKDLKPSGTIISMGLAKKHTPYCLIDVLGVPDVTEIIHIELDCFHRTSLSNKESVIWDTDFLKYLQTCDDNSVDGVVCWHGPEHLSKKHGRKMIDESVRVAKRWVIISCPWDRLDGWREGPKDKDHLGHKSVWNENDFIEKGFRVAIIGERQMYPGYIISWKVKKI